MTASRNINKPAHRWTPAELAIMLARYPHEPSEALALELGVPLHSLYRKAKSLGLKKTAAFTASPLSGRIKPGEKRGAQTQFQKGNVSHNKGVKGVCGVHPNSRKTQFQKGHKLNGEVPLGTVLMKSNGYMMRKVAQTGHTPDDWKLEHRLRWEAINGPVPDGYCLHFIDRNRRNVEPSNMELLPKGEIVLRYGISALPPELRRIHQLRGAIARRINRHEQRTDNN